MESFICFLQIVKVVFLILLHHNHQTCDAITNYSNNQTYCPPSSCGKITKIKHPFRLKGDPTSCGDPRYELSCENNMTVLTLFSGKYYVKSIDYKFYTIRLVDHGIQEGNCSSVPRYFLTKSNFTSSYNYSYRGDPYEVPSSPWVGHVLYLNCSKPVKNDPRYVDTSPCVKWNFKGHVYAIANDINTGRLNVGCHVKLVATSSASSLLENFFSDNTSQTLSYAEIHGILSYGFDLTWVRRACDDFCDTKQDCQLNREIGKLECYLDYCSTPLGNFVNCGKEEFLFSF
ncbi:rust resistance kinase Lr10 [Trifolium repens]|nr:rust resistance kinase Lr10 [Trifolium repens]